MAESTAENADTLSKELKKILTEIFHGGGDSSEADGVSGIVKSIDDAIVRIMTEFDSKKKKPPESQIFSVPPSPPPPPSAPVVFPEEFKCALSYTIMNEPVIIASGLTYEKKYIREWLKDHNTCPRSKKVLPHRLFVPNHLVDDLIAKWFQANNFVRLKPPVDQTVVVVGLSSDAIDSLLNRVSSPISDKDQIEAAGEIRRQTRRFDSVRAFFVDELDDSITRLIRPISRVHESTLDWSSELQEHIIATLFNISVLEKNKVVIAETLSAISLLRRSLLQGTVKTRRKAVGTLLSLLTVSSNMEIIGNSASFKDLVKLIEDDDYLATTDAAFVLHSLCVEPHYRMWAISAGFITVLVDKVKAGTNVDVLLNVLAAMCVHEGIIDLIAKKGVISDLLSILRKQSSLLDCENALNILLFMCDMETSKYIDDIVKEVGEEENKHATFTLLVKERGSGVVARNAYTVLQWLKRYRTGKKPVLE